MSATPATETQNVAPGIHDGISDATNDT
jgi:hypothetical protein